MYKKKKCMYCKKETTNKKFCSISCTRKYTWEMPSSPYKTKEYSNKISLNKKEWYKHNEHPRGMLGKKQSDYSKKVSSDNCKKRIGNKHPYWKGGTQPYWNKIARKIMKDVSDICYYGQKNNKLNKCKGEILVHHKDGNIKNNKKKNLVKTCEHHHLSYYHKKEILNRMDNMNKARLKKIKENPKWWKEIIKKGNNKKKMNKFNMEKKQNVM
jgi:hypothetical protein